MSISKKLGNALNEKDVENIYREELRLNIENSTITSPYGCDGLLETKNLRCLLEFKYDTALKNKLSQCNILIQCLYYLKKFEDSGEKLPTTLFLGDSNECAAISTASIVKYLSSEIDWKIAPSEAHKRNTELIQAMVGDVNVLPFVFDVDDKFHIKDVIEKIKDLSENVIRKIRVTPKNIVPVFDYFDKNIADKFSLNTNQKANLFIQTIINPNENYIHPKKKNVFVTKSYGDIVVSQNLFKSFFQHFEGDLYSPKEKETLTGYVDKITAEVTRRRQGFFSTPSAFADKAHEYISNEFGADWKEKYVVWDNCSGIAQLTRDYKFSELYMSTLEQSELDTTNQMGYNPESIKFQYDFLNDDSSKLPIGLKNAIRDGKEIIFFINPPYARSAANGGNNKIEKGTGDTETSVKMKKDGWGPSSANLYAQFIYRIYNIQKINKNIKICLFSPPLFLSGSSYKSFRKPFFKSFNFLSGFLFEARHFSDVAKNWGISFSIFTNKTENVINSDIDNFNFDILDFNDEFELNKIGTKNIYNTDNTQSLSDWCVTKDKPVEFPKFSSSIITKETNFGCGLPENCFSTLVANSNNVYKNTSSVYLINGGIVENVGKHFVKKENLLKVTSLFTARKCIQPNWVNCKDEYLAPNEQHINYEQFTYDSIIYSLFNNSSQQSSLRQIDYKEKKYDVKNEFFWLSKKSILNLAEENSYDNLYKDSKNGEERFIYNKLFGEERIYDKLSSDAKIVIDMASELLVKSIQMRKLVDEEHPEYYLSSFDCGYAQLKLVWKQYFKEEFDVFRETYKQFENRLKPMIYELGFLRS